MSATTTDSNERPPFRVYEEIETTNRDVKSLATLAREFLLLAESDDGTYLKLAAPGLAIVVNAIVKKARIIDALNKELWALTKGGAR